MSIFLKWNKCGGGQSLIRNYVPAQFLNHYSECVIVLEVFFERTYKPQKI